MNYPDIEFSCPHCEVILKVRTKAEGLTGPCPKCGKPITAPEIKAGMETTPDSPTKLGTELKDHPEPPAKSLIPEKTHYPVSERNHLRKKPKSLLGLLIPVTLLAFLAGGVVAILKYQQQDPDTASTNPPEKQITSATEEAPKTPAAIPQTIPEDLPAGKSPQTEPATPPLKVTPTRSKKLEHDPQDLSHPGEIPPVILKNSSAFLHAPTTGSKTMEAFITQSAYCFENLPTPKTKATVRIYESEQGKEIGKAYLSHESAVYKKLSNLMPPGERNQQTITVRWNTREDPQTPYLEVVALN